MPKDLNDATDRELVAATLKDREAFSAIVRRYEASLRRYVSRLGSDDPEATKDILQESFIKAYVNLNGYDPALSFSAWLYRIAHNETIDHFRRLKRRPRPMTGDDDPELLAQVADRLDIEKETDARRRNALLQAAIADLDQRYRDVIVLRYFEEKSYDEISDILRIPHGTVATSLHRAKTELKKRLKASAYREA